MLTLYHEDRRSYSALYKLVLRIEGLRNPVVRVFALKLFCDLLDIIAPKTD